MIGRDIVPPLSDEVQLTVEEYRNKLYELIMQKKLERRRRRKEEEDGKLVHRGRSAEQKEQVPPSEPADHATAEHVKVAKHQDVHKSSKPQYTSECKID